VPFLPSGAAALYGVGSSFEILPYAGDLRSVVKPLFWRSAIAVTLFSSVLTCVPLQEVS